jgi:TldD protein
VHDLAEQIIDRARRLGATFADVRLMDLSGTSILVQDGRADKVSEWRVRGCGVRVLVDGAWALSNTEALSRRALEECLEDAVGLARASAHHVLDPGEVAPAPAVRAVIRPTLRRDPATVSAAEKMGHLTALERAGVAAGQGHIVNSVVSYADSRRHMVCANTFGSLVDDETVRVGASATMVAEADGLRERSMEVRRWTDGYERVAALAAEDFSVSAARKALGLCAARPAPAGPMPVVFHPSITGLLAHEALGHNAEADGVWTGESILAGKLGEPIAAECVTIVDDSTVPGAYGSYAYDSECTPSGRRTIVERGRLLGYLHSLETAAKMHAEPTGSARAEDHGAPPLVRMSNTFLLPGATPVAQIFAGIDRGVYLEDGHWGYVYVEHGHYVCNAGRGHLIEHGQLGEPLRDVCVGGLTLETLKDIEAVADDFEMQNPGTCGKGGQGAAVDCGGPHVRVRRLVVGGQQT